MVDRATPLILVLGPRTLFRDVLGLALVARAYPVAFDDRISATHSRDTVLVLVEPDRTHWAMAASLRHPTVVVMGDTRQTSLVEGVLSCANAVLGVDASLDDFHRAVESAVAEMPLFSAAQVGALMSGVRSMRSTERRRWRRGGTTSANKASAG